MNQREDSVSLIWNNLSFQVTKKVWTMELGLPTRSTIHREILKPQNGEIYSGSLTALMGPSGAGKSTLFNCLTGRYVSGLSGELVITCRGSKPKAKIAFVPQNDDLFRTFTVRETLMFASRMKNLSKDKNHQDETMRVMQDLHLVECSEVKLAKCSGGQVKRVCIGVELVSSPDILVLDEPTTGLDSSTAFDCISLLRRLVESKVNPPAIIATIHQPNHKIFLEFNMVYLLSRFGERIYLGEPSKMIDFFSSYGLQCPKYCNPADYAIEVAAGGHGEDVFAKMRDDSRLTVYKGEGRGERYDLHKVVFKLRSKKLPIIRHSLSLMLRSWQHTWRDSNQFSFQCVLSVLVAFIFSYLWVNKVGRDNGCWSSYSVIDEAKAKENIFKLNITASKDQFMEKISHMMDNSALLFACNMFSVLTSLILCTLSFPLETNVILKEIGNNWYRTSAYFWAKCICGLPTIVLFQSIFSLIIYPLTEQMPDIWRFILFVLVICLLAEVCQSLGSFIGISLSSDIVSAVLAACAFSVPLMIFAGFLVRYSAMPWYFKPLSYISFMRYSFEGLLVTVYGFDRCSQATGATFVERFARAYNPQELFRSVWSTMNVTYNDVVRYSYLLDVDKECLGDVVNKTIDYYGLKYFGSDARAIESVTSTPDAGASEEYEDTGYEVDDNQVADGVNASYILSYFEINDDTLWVNIGCLIGWSIAMKILMYSVLKYKTRSTL